MSHPGSSPSSATFSRLLAVAFATLVVALAFGADFGFSGESAGRTGAAEWRSSSRGLGSILPWGNDRARRKVTPLQDAKMRLSDERKRRVESEKSLSLARTRLGEVESTNESLKQRIQLLELELRERDHEISELNIDVARASAASPELVDRFLSLADEAIHAARFATALALSDDASKMLRTLAPADSPGRVARLEFIRATAQVAMGDDAAAARSLARLLEVAPDFDLDESNSSPKLVRVLASIRADRV